MREQRSLHVLGERLVQHVQPLDPADVPPDLRRSLPLFRRRSRRRRLAPGGQSNRPHPLRRLPRRSRQLQPRATVRVERLDGGVDVVVAAQRRRPRPPSLDDPDAEGILPGHPDPRLVGALEVRVDPLVALDVRRVEVLHEQLLLRRALRPRRAVVKLHRVPHRLHDAKPVVPRPSARGLVAHLLAGEEHAEHVFNVSVAIRVAEHEDVLQSLDRETGAVGFLAVVRDRRAEVDARSFAEDGSGARRGARAALWR